MRIRAALEKRTNTGINRNHRSQSRCRRLLQPCEERRFLPFTTTAAALSLVVLLMGFFSLFRSGVGTNIMKEPFSFSARTKSSSSSSSRSPVVSAAAAAASVPLPSAVVDKKALQAVVTAALWSFFAGDALSSPTHWFYGGFRQVQQYYGVRGIAGYTKPVYELAGSILNKSNLSGGGRSTGSSGSSSPLEEDTIIGNVINHGKQNLWDPALAGKGIHYHATLQAGENTLEASLARVLLQSLAATGGSFDADHFRQAYVSFMTTPGSHNDTYASTCHRMFFANYHYSKRAAVDCPDNDAHNVDTVDGLVLPTVTALAVAGRIDGTQQQAAAAAAATVRVTRNSRQLERYAAEWGAVVFRAVRAAAAARSSKEEPLAATSAGVAALVQSAAAQMAQNLGLRTPQIRQQDEITACYLDSAVPAMLDTLVKYSSSGSGSDSSSISVWDALIANANTGGENVHRGSCLGAVLGAVAAAAAPPTTGAATATVEPKDSVMIAGLYHQTEIQQEIHSLLDALAASGSDPVTTTEQTTTTTDKQN